LSLLETCQGLAVGGEETASRTARQIIQGGHRLAPASDHVPRRETVPLSKQQVESGEPSGEKAATRSSVSVEAQLGQPPFQSFEIPESHDANDLDAGGPGSCRRAEKREEQDRKKRDGPPQPRSPFRLGGARGNKEGRGQRFFTRRRWYKERNMGRRAEGTGPFGIGREGGRRVGEREKRRREQAPCCALEVYAAGRRPSREGRLGAVGNKCTTGQKAGA